MAKTRSEFIGFIHAETIKAILFQDHFWGNPMWFPKSQLVYMSEDTLEVRISASSWICGQNGIKEFEERLFMENEDA